MSALSFFAKLWATLQKVLKVIFTVFRPVPAVCPLNPDRGTIVSQCRGYQASVIVVLIPKLTTDDGSPVLIDAVSINGSPLDRRSGVAVVDPDSARAGVSTAVGVPLCWVLYVAWWKVRDQQSAKVEQWDV